jgi:hypothetical protein
MDDENTLKPYGEREGMVSDDDERERDGVYPTEYDLEGEEAMAQRDELERQVAQLVLDAETWLENTTDPDARQIYDLLLEVHDLLGNPPEEE